MPVLLANNALSRPERIRLLIDPNLPADHEILIRHLINGFSLMAEGQSLCNREWERKERTETYVGGVSRVFLKAPPIDLDETLTVIEDPDGKVIGANTLT